MTDDRLDRRQAVASFPASGEAAGRIAGALGLTPFIVLSLWLYGITPHHPWYQGTIHLLLIYSAVVLSFLGGIRWGIAIGKDDARQSLEFWVALLPALIGWLAVVAPVPMTFGILAAAFAAQGAWDAVGVHLGRAPRWYGRLRMVLTVCVVGAELLAFVATA